MHATILSITSRKRDPHSLFLARRADFETVEVGKATAEQVIEDPNVTLYALDPETNQALFVETPADADLPSKPFFYQAQAQQAQRLIAVPYALFCQWAESCPVPNQVAFVYTVGRCGSTLLSKLFQGVRDLLSFSEPDVFSHIDLLLWSRAVSVEEASKLLRASLRFTWKPRIKIGSSWLVVKLRNQVPAIAPLMEREFPATHRLFMYRNAEDVIGSYLRIRRVPEAAERLRERLRLIMRAEGIQCPLDELFAEFGQVGLEVLQWAWAVEHYRQMRSRSPDFMALRYEDLVADVDGVMDKLLRNWGVHWDPSVTARVMSVDSQEDTIFARPSQKTTLSDEERDVVRRLLPRVSKVNAADEILPGTIR